MDYPPRDRKYSTSSSAGSMYSTSATSIFSEGSTRSSVWSRPDTAPPYHTAPGVGLPCEFVGYTSCDLVFPVNDVEGWIDHIVSHHLQGRLPSISRCWYCDDVVFDSRTAGGLNINFQQRMWHIRDHILDGLSANQIRPDHYLNEHLRRHRLISDDVYHSVRRYTEVPQPSGICSLDEIPPELQPTDRHYGYEYRNREEERRERRHRHKSGKSRK